MRLRILVSNTQIWDIAPRDDNLGLLLDDFCKVGEIISPQLSVDTTFESLKKLEGEEKSLRLIDDSEPIYNIRGEILAGVKDYEGIFLVVDCGVLLRVRIKDPREYRLVESEDGGKMVPVKREHMEKFVFRKGDFISFNGEISAMWLDMWGGIVRTNSHCMIVDRLERRRGKLIELLLTVECQFPEKPLVEIDHYIARKFRMPVIWGDQNEFTVEY